MESNFDDNNQVVTRVDGKGILEKQDSVVIQHQDDGYVDVSVIKIEHRNENYVDLNITENNFGNQ
eukprot:Awhi_evm1s2420